MTLTRRTFLFAFLLLIAAIGALTAQQRMSTAGADQDVSIAKKSKIVGSVTAVGGSKKLQLKKGKKLVTAKKGTKLALGDTLVPGKKLTATITLVRPKSVKAGTELILLKPAKGAKQSILVLRKSTTKTIVQIKAR